MSYPYYEAVLWQVNQVAADALNALILLQCELNTHKQQHNEG